MSNHRGRVLVVAGSDSSGGAGLEADQKVLATHNCYAATATTALTAQNTLGVEDIHHTPPEFVKKLIEVVLKDVEIDVIKIGMLASAETIEVVARQLRKHVGIPTVVDSVMVTSSGHRLLPTVAVSKFREQILPLTTILTPNIPEALIILPSLDPPENEPKDISQLVKLAKCIHALGPEYVLLKGGHLPLKKDGSAACSEKEKDIVIDVLVTEEDVIKIEKPYFKSKNTHGTGCSLASAIAANLAKGVEMKQAVINACRYVQIGIETAAELGKGNGPINHFHSSYVLPFAPGYFIEYLLERSDVQQAWEAYTQHDFVIGLADGSLPVETFKYYLVQDYLFLIQFVRANALASYKAKTMKDITASAKLVAKFEQEMLLHVEYCQEYGIRKEQMETAQESQACVAYTRYVLDIGQSEDWLALQFAMAPCLMGYSQIAQRLYTDPKTKREGNPYWKWIKTYAAADFRATAKAQSDLIDRHAHLQSPSRIEELVEIFIQAIDMETGFWGMKGTFKGKAVVI